MMLAGRSVQGKKVNMMLAGRAVQGKNVNMMLAGTAVQAKNVNVMLVGHTIILSPLDDTCVKFIARSGHCSQVGRASAQLCTDKHC